MPLVTTSQLCTVPEKLLPIYHMRPLIVLQFGYYGTHDNPLYGTLGGTHQEIHTALQQVKLTHLSCVLGVQRSCGSRWYRSHM